MKTKLILITALIFTSDALAENFDNPVIDISEVPGIAAANQRATILEQNDRNTTNAIIFEATKSRNSINPYFNSYVGSQPIVIAPAPAQNGVVVNGIFFPSN